MFQAALSERLKRIFDLEKVTFDVPGESQEQECIFIQIDTARNTIKDGLQVAKVAGKIRVYCNNEKLPYGYFTKKIQEAIASDTKDLFFYDLEESSGVYRNISERSMSFIYFFNSQYNPEVGSLTSITFQ